MLDGEDLFSRWWDFDEKKPLFFVVVQRVRCLKASSSVVVAILILRKRNAPPPPPPPNEAVDLPPATFDARVRRDVRESEREGGRVSSERQQLTNRCNTQTVGTHQHQLTEEN